MLLLILPVVMCVPSGPQRPSESIELVGTNVNRLDPQGSQAIIRSGVSDRDEVYNLGDNIFNFGILSMVQAQWIEISSMNGAVTRFYLGGRVIDSTHAYEKFLLRKISAELGIDLVEFTKMPMEEFAQLLNSGLEKLDWSLTDDAAERRVIGAERTVGLVLQELPKGSLFHLLGLQPGDYIYEINERPMYGVEEVFKTRNYLDEQNERFVLKYQRDGRSHAVVVDMKAVIEGNLV